MKINDIKATVRKSLGIAEFNPMQTAVAVSDSSRIVLLSPTGSGKTLAFATAVLKRINGGRKELSHPQAIIVAPSRELVRQTYDVVRQLAAHFGIKTLALYGGNPFSAEEASLRGEMPGIIVATPGRLLDHINRGTLDVDKVENVVLDEYDKILELGFHDEMKRIARRVGSRLKGGQPGFVMVTSATQLETVPDFINLGKAEIIDFRPQTSLPERLRIVNVPSPGRDKLETLAALIRNVAKNGSCIVFVNHRESADRVADYLKKQKISAAVYHGGLDQQQREIALATFDSKAAKVLVSTDLAGRGIDIEGVRSVIHYHPAADEQIWTHRNGRTARIDNTGDIYAITSPDENIPDFVDFDNDFYPDMTLSGRIDAEKSLVYFDRGKRDKISRGDIAGFVMKKAQVPPQAVGKITLGLAYSLLAVDEEYVDAVIKATRTDKVKNTRLRASRIS